MEEGRERERGEDGERESEEGYEKGEEERVGERKVERGIWIEGCRGRDMEREGEIGGWDRGREGGKRGR